MCCKQRGFGRLHLRSVLQRRCDRFGERERSPLKMFDDLLKRTIGIERRVDGRDGLTANERRKHDRERDAKGDNALTHRGWRKILERTYSTGRVVRRRSNFFTASGAQRKRQQPIQSLAQTPPFTLVHERTWLTCLTRQKLRRNSGDDFTLQCARALRGGGEAESTLGELVVHIG